MTHKNGHNKGNGNGGGDTSGGGGKGGGKYKTIPILEDFTFNVDEGITFSESVIAYDGDNFDIISYSFADGSLSYIYDDGTIFDIDQYTGLITTDTPLDYELTATYSLTVLATDLGGNTDTGTVTITVTGTNDEPVIEGSTDPAPIAEIVGDSSAQDIPPQTGTITISDADVGDPMTLSVTGNATVTYSGGDISNPLSALNNADTADGSPDSIDVSALIDSSAITFTTPPPFVSNGGTQVWDWVYDPAPADLDWLRIGKTLTITYDAQVDDGTIVVGTQPLVITITGTNDDVAVNNDTGMTDVNEALDASAQVVTGSGTLTIEDQDVGDTITYTVVTATFPVEWSGGMIPGAINTSPLTNLANLVVNGGATNLSNGETFDAGYAYTSGSTDLDWLNAGETLTISYNVKVDDGTTTTTQTVSITIYGADDDPIANDDFAQTDQDTVFIAPGSVLDNDDPVDITDTLSVLKVAGVDVPGGGLNINSTAGGILSMNQDGTYQFDPNGEYDQLDVAEIAVENIELTISNDEGVTTTSNLQIIIEGINDVPVAVNDVGPHVNEDDLAPTASGYSVLDNDDDVDDETIDITEIEGVPVAFNVPTLLSSGALVTMASDGTFDYDPNGAWEFLDAGDIGLDTFTYTISDGDLTDTATVTVTVEGEDDTDDIVFFGSIAADIYTGVDGISYFLIGNNGDDTLTGANKDDLIEGGKQADELDGRAGDDTIDGSAGDDTITGGEGADFLTGGGQSDLFVFDDGDSADAAFMENGGAGVNSGDQYKGFFDVITDFDLDGDDQLDLTAVNNDGTGGDVGTDPLGANEYAVYQGSWDGTDTFTIGGGADAILVYDQDAGGNDAAIVLVGSSAVFDSADVTFT